MSSFPIVEEHRVWLERLLNYKTPGSPWTVTAVTAHHSYQFVARHKTGFVTMSASFDAFRLSTPEIIEGESDLIRRRFQKHEQKDNTDYRNEEKVMLNNKQVVKAYGMTQGDAEAIQTRLNDWAESGKPFCVIPMNEGEELYFDVVEYGEEIAVGHNQSPQLTITGPVSQLSIEKGSCQYRYIPDEKYKKFLWYESVYHEAVKMTADGVNLTEWFKGLAAYELDLLRREKEEEFLEQVAAQETNRLAREKDGRVVAVVKHEPGPNAHLDCDYPDCVCPKTKMHSGGDWIECQGGWNV